MDQLSAPPNQTRQWRRCGSTGADGKNSQVDVKLHLGELPASRCLSIQSLAEQSWMKSGYRQSHIRKSGGV